MVPPSQEVAKSTGELDTVVLANKDRVSATAVALADGAFVVKTSHGEFRPPIDKVTDVIFRNTDRRRPRRRKNDVRVTTAASRFTLELQQLSADHLVGKAEHLGQVKLRRDALRTIEFNIYK